MDATVRTQPGRFVVQPGEWRVSAEPAVLSTLLGSCVAVCLYDPINRVIGMNHFLLAVRRPVRGRAVLTSEAGRYGIEAMELLINDLMEYGARRANLKAKAFGGANVLGTRCDQSGFPCVGTTNVRFVREFLRTDGIPLVAADLGGTFGRHMRFASKDYSVHVRKINPLRSRALWDEERVYWREASQDTAPTPVEFW